MFSEQDVDRELMAALSVSPSPDFEARVLQRVEADRPSHWPSHYGWLAAAASLVLVAGVFYAALLIGLLDFVLKTYLPQGGTVFIYILTILLLLWRPQGLFGKTT